MQTERASGICHVVELLSGSRGNRVPDFIGVMSEIEGLLKSRTPAPWG